MARQFDGSIRIGVDVDFSNMAKSTEEVKRRLEAVKSVLERSEKALQNAFDGQIIEHTAAAMETTRRKIAALVEEYNKLLFSDQPPKSVIAMEREIARLETQIKRADAEYAKLAAEQTALAERSVTVNGVSSLTAEEKARFQELDSLIIKNGYTVDELNAKVEALRKNVAQVKANPEISAEAKKLASSLDEAVIKLESLNRKASSSDASIRKATGTKPVKTFNKEIKNSGSYVNQLGGHFQRLGARILGTIKNALIFSVIYSALGKLRDEIGKTLKTNETFAKNLEIIKNNLKAAFYPIYTAALPAINSLIQAIAKVTGMLSEFINGIFGKTPEQSLKAANSLFDYADAMEGATKESKKAEKQAKKTERALAGFDLLNVLATPKADENTEDLSDKLNRSEEAAKGNAGEALETTAPDVTIFEKLLELLQPTIDKLHELNVAMEPFKEFLWEGLKIFFYDVLVPIGTWTLGTGFPEFVRIFTTFFATQNWARATEDVNGTFNAVAQFGSWVTSEGWPQFVETTKRLASEIDLTFIASALNNLFYAVEPFGEQIGQGLLWFYENAIAPLIVWAANNFIPTAVDLISAAINALSPIIDAVKPGLEWLWENLFRPAAAFVGDGIINFLGWLTEKLQAFAEWAKNNPQKIQVAADVILGFLSGLWIYNTSKNIINFLSLLGAGIVDFCTNSLPKLAAAALPALAVGTLAAGIVALAEAWPKMSGAEKAITIFSALAAAVLSAALAIAVFHTSWTVGIAAAAIAAGIVALVAAFSKLGGKVPDISSGFSSAMENASISQFSSSDLDAIQTFEVPALAKGAVIPPNSEFLALLGDQKHGTNIETPLETMVEAFRQAQGDQNQSSVNVMFTGNLAELGRVLRPVVTKENNRVGNVFATGGVY